VIFHFKHPNAPYTPDYISFGHLPGLLASPIFD